MCSSTYVKGVYYTTIGVGFNLSNKVSPSVDPSARLIVAAPVLNCYQEPSVCLSDVVGRKIAEQVSLVEHQISYRD